MGYGPNKGIVPLAFEALFEKIENEVDKNIKHQVTFSMLEIYMEQVTDLCAKSDKSKKGGLKVRQNPKLGRFFVEGLSKTPVASFAEINQKMEEGTNNRTVAATNMNATSSRAHTVVTLQYDQIITGDDGKKTTRTSEMNLIDLAGSERAESTGATGDRLKEGAQINKSLSALGNVISALAAGKKAPFRDSVLTKLLQNSLGGNSKTIMIAALSPADINYDETLSTLRYADRAKQIKNKAAVNESATDKLIRELREENARIKALLEGGVDLGNTAGMSEAEVAKMKKKMEADIRAQLEQSQNQLDRNDESEFEKRLAEMHKQFEENQKGADAKTLKLSTEPHLVNLNEDPSLSGVVVHFLKAGANTVGRRVKGEALPDIPLSGLSIQQEHCTIDCDGADFMLTIAKSKAVVLVNGKPVEGSTKLQYNDRVQFGTNHLFVFKDPRNVPAEGAKDIDWDFAQSEIAEAKGFGAGIAGGGGITNELREQIMELLPMVAEANAIADRLKKRFEKAHSMCVYACVRVCVRVRVGFMLQLLYIYKLSTINRFFDKGE